MKFAYHKVFVLFYLLSMAFAATGQTNLALTATATAYTSDAGGLFQWSTINDGNYGTCGTQQAFIWNSNVGVLPNQEMTFTWSAARTVNKLVIHHGEAANRSLTGCTVQYWNGSSWVNHAVVTLPQQCINTINITPVTTTAIRLTDHKASGSGQQTNMNYREIEIFGPVVNNDAALTFLTNPDVCSYTQPIIAKVTNAGKKMMDSFRLYWSVNSVIQSVNYITSSLPTGKDTSITLSSSFTFTANTNYTIKAWTLMPNGAVDSVPANDQITLSLPFMGNPSAPTTTNIAQCGNGNPLLNATPETSTDNILWYSSASGGNVLGLGTTITGPYIRSNTSFYAQSVRLGSYLSLSTPTGSSGINLTQSNYYGGMLTMNVNNSIMLDSITVRLWYNTSPSEFRLYYKTGTYSGFETNPNAWTLINSGRARYFISGGQYFARVATKFLLLNASQNYSFYYTVDISSGGTGNSLVSINIGNTVANNDLGILSGGRILLGLFGATQVVTNYYPYMDFMYRKSCYNNSRVLLSVKVKPRPTGADLVKGPIFQGQFNQGNQTVPDVIEAGKTIIYDILPPTGYTNTEYGNTWFIKNINTRTRSGYLIPGSDYNINMPYGGGSGNIVFTPKSRYIDSLITLNVQYADLGPHFCDSIISRTFVVAATPKAGFKFPSSICVGDDIVFENTSSVKSGTMAFTWSFGNGDTSDFQTPAYAYKKAGIYQVKLIARSSPWSVMHDTTITISVGEIPAIRFKVTNTCEGQAVNFQNQTSISSGTLEYDWDFGDKSPHSSAKSPSHQYNVQGTCLVTLKASADGCVATLVKSAHTFARPIAGFTAPLVPVCTKTRLIFPNTSTIPIGYLGAYWTFGDGKTSTQINSSTVYETDGIYQIQLLAVSEFGCKDSIKKSLIVKPSPTPEFTGNQFCSKGLTSFTNNTIEALSNTTYQWIFSDGYTSSLKHPARTWPFEGPYTATLKAGYPNGCEASITKTFDVLSQAKADFSAADVCSGETARFVNLSLGDRADIRYFWDFGNGNTSTDDVPVSLYNPKVSTTYTVTLVASYTDGCSDTMRKTITASEVPVCDFTTESLGFLSWQFIPANPVYTYEWFFGEGGTSRQSSPTYKYRYKGNFNVTMIATNAAGCTCQISKYLYAIDDIRSLTGTSNIHIYPNPNNGLFTVENTLHTDMRIEVYNILGNKIFESTDHTENQEIDLRNHAPGIYMVKVKIQGIICVTMLTLE